MKRFIVLLLVMFGLFPFVCYAQRTMPDIPCAPTPKPASNLAGSSYSQSTQGERFKTYIRQTYGIGSILEAGAKAGIEQARDKPNQWPQGATGYADRFGSSFGENVVKHTTEYLVADIFREDLRRKPPGLSRPQSKFVAALQDTFLARKGDDGHEVFSVARLIGPVAASLVARSWYPSGPPYGSPPGTPSKGNNYGGVEIIRHIGLHYGFSFAHNYLRDLIRH